MFGFWKRASSPPSGVRLPEGVLECLRSLRIDLSALAPLLNPQRSDAYVFPLKGRHAPAAWQALEKQLPRQGYWPALLGDDESLERHRESATDPPRPSPSEIVSLAAGLSVDELLRRWREGAIDPDDTRGPETVEGAWPDSSDINPGFHCCVHCSTGKPLPRVWMGLFPATDGCEVAAHLGFGEWNACPKPEEHVAILKHWQRNFDIRLVAVAADIVELRAGRRPGTREGALALAREQYYYCSDIVDQGVGTIAALARSLLESDYWFFWWD